LHIHCLLVQKWVPVIMPHWAGFVKPSLRLTGAAVSGMLNGAQFTIGGIAFDLARKLL